MLNFNVYMTYLILNLTTYLLESYSKCKYIYESTIYLIHITLADTMSTLILFKLEYMSINLNYMLTLNVYISNYH